VSNCIPHECSTKRQQERFALACEAVEVFMQLFWRFKRCEEVGFFYFHNLTFRYDLKLTPYYTMWDIIASIKVPKMGLIVQGGLVGGPYEIQADWWVGPDIYERKTHFGFFARGSCYAAKAWNCSEPNNFVTSICLFK